MSPAPLASLRAFTAAPCLVALALASSGCEKEDEVPIPDVTGAYTVQYGTRALGGDCQQVDPDLSGGSYASWIGGSVPPIGGLDVTQDGTSITLRFDGCDFLGNVGADGAYWFGGACDDPDTGAVLDVSSEGTITIDEGARKKVLQGSVSMEADFQDSAAGPGPDGTFDCTRTGSLDAQAPMI
ncbi:hypothetical protein L6R50_20460 [Myxococcota bacterium]|nr:hypothetical protein [Myxococcota bacterium]